MAEFTSGTLIPLTLGEQAEIVNPPSHGQAGGQGAVYEVKINNNSYALKWYTNSELLKNSAFKANLEKNIKLKTPDERFFWPLYLTEEKDGAYGYVMDLCPQGYAKLPAIYNWKAKFKNNDAKIVACLNLLSAFKSLHGIGLKYMDLNDGSFFINVETGAVKICDCDNVSPGGSENVPGVTGKAGWMAPEIVVGEATPDIPTDLHSLAVVLFKLLIRHDPFEGKRMAEMDVTDDYVLKGSNPIFIFNPADDSNRPTLSDQVNARVNWPKLPLYIQKLFEKTFVDGIKDPNRRADELSWQKALLKWRDENFDMVECPVCKEHEVTVLSEKLVCKKCKNVLSPPAKLIIGEYSVPLLPGKKLYEYQINVKVDIDKIDYSVEAGEIIASKRIPGLLGIRNTSKITWQFTGPKDTGSIESGATIPIICGTRISFNGPTGLLAFQLSGDGYTIPLYPGRRIYGRHTGGSEPNKLTGEIIASKDNPCKWGLINKSDATWNYKDPFGKQGAVPPEATMTLVENSIINFKGVTGKITG